MSQGEYPRRPLQSRRIKNAEENAKKILMALILTYLLGKACKDATLLFKDPKCTYLVVVRGAAVLDKIRSVKTVRREEAAVEAGGTVPLGAGTAFIR